MTNRRLRHPVPRTIEFAGSDGTRLAGTLTPPPGTAQFPAVLAGHAAGGGTRDAPPHRHLASFLPSLGVATFSYDRRGEGSSDGRPGPPLAVLAGDARAAFRLSHASRGAPQPYRAVGHSQGGWIAPMATASPPHLSSGPDLAADESVLEDEAAFEWDLDISSALSQLRIPVLPVYGEADRWVPRAWTRSRRAAEQRTASWSSAITPSWRSYPAPRPG